MSTLSVCLSTIFSFALLLGLSSIGGRTLSYASVPPATLAHLQIKKRRVSKQRAIAIAKADMLKTHQSLEKFRLVVCEKLTLWLIIFDGEGPEYYISKWDGAILKIDNIPQGTSKSDRAPSLTESRITKAEAIRIARKDALESYGEQAMRPFIAHACELMNAWRVVFDVRVPRGTPMAKLPNAHPPYYVIDKHTGKILDKQIFN